MSEMSHHDVEANTVLAYGLPGYGFTLIHATAVVSLTVSASVSRGVLVHLISPIRTFHNQPIRDRLVVYLAISDLLFSISHVIDHGSMLAFKGESI